MSGFAVEGDVQLVVAEEILAAAGDGVGRKRPAVRGQSHMDGDEVHAAVQMSLVHDGLGPVISLLCRLEDDFDPSLQLFLSFHQSLCQSQPDGGMGVVAAGVDAPVVAGDVALVKRSEALFLRLLVRQAVDVEPKRRKRSFPPRIQLDNDTRISETGNGNESTYSEAQSAAEPTAKMLNSDAEFE